MTLEADKSSDVQSASGRPGGTAELLVPCFSLSPKVGIEKVSAQRQPHRKNSSNLGASQQFGLILMFWSLTDRMRFNHSREDHLLNQSV